MLEAWGLVVDGWFCIWLELVNKLGGIRSVCVSAAGFTVFLLLLLAVEVVVGGTNEAMDGVGVVAVVVLLPEVNGYALGTLTTAGGAFTPAMQVTVVAARVAEEGLLAGGLIWASVRGSTRSKRRVVLMEICINQIIGNNIAINSQCDISSSLKQAQRLLFYTNTKGL